MHVLGSPNQLTQELWTELTESFFSLLTYGLHDLFNFSDVNNLFGRTGDGPVFQQATDKLNTQLLVLLDEILHASQQLGIEVLQASNLVERNKCFHGKHLMLLFQRGGIANDDGTEDFE